MKNCIYCISWSPKGKQLTVGNAIGELIQLKPDLTQIRVNEAPKNVFKIGTFLY